MVLKRKRSDCELDPVFSSDQRMDSGSFNFNSMAAMDTARRGFFAPRLSTPSHLPSRTMKRFRDNRPSESEVHQHTLDVLFSAQRRPHESQHASSQPASVASSEAPTHAQAQAPHACQQRSLHSFWSLPGSGTPTSSLASSPASSTISPPSPALAPRSIATNCEDCGAGLTGDDDDVMIDVDDFGLSPEDHACGACGKFVCFSCSISNLGEHRRCLSCAGPRGGGGGGGSFWTRR